MQPIFELLLQLAKWLLPKLSASEETKKSFYLFIENYNNDHSIDSAKAKEDVEKQLEHWKGKK